MRVALQKSHGNVILFSPLWETLGRGAFLIRHRGRVAVQCRSTFRFFFRFQQTRLFLMTLFWPWIKVLTSEHLHIPAHVASNTKECVGVCSVHRSHQEAKSSCVRFSVWLARVSVYFNWWVTRTLSAATAEPDDILAYVTNVLICSLEINLTTDCRRVWNLLLVTICTVAVICFYVSRLIILDDWIILYFIWLLFTL